MKLVKSLLLGSAAGLAAVAGAQAADLPVAKAAAVEYVRVCSAYGAGFFYIPGTETCLRIGGRVRADYLYNEPLFRSEDAIGFRARGRIQADARTETAYGTLRALVRFEITRSSGTPFGNEGVIRQGPDLAQAFIQFGGLTAGRVTSFFSNGDLPTGHMGTLRFDDAPDVDLLAYTFSFGNGFSATISIEDGLDRRRGLLNPGFVGPVLGGPVPYAGQRLPDLVGNVKYTAAWGTAQLSGAIHQIRSVVLGNGQGTGNVPGAFAPGLVGTIPDNEYGFAIAGYVGVNLPMLGAGDALWLAATYADGAPAYLDGGNSGTIITPFAAFQGFTGSLADATIDPITGDLDKTRAWSIAGGLRHYWTPQIRSNLFASYLDAEGRGATNVNDFDELRIGANIFWQPVSGLDIGVEVIYATVDQRANNLALFNDEDNGWEGRLRIQRDF